MKEELDRRREIVRCYYYSGLTPEEMVKRLSDSEADIFPPTLRYKQRLSAIKHDIKAIQQQNYQQYLVTFNDAQISHAEYVARQTYLYQQAVESRHYALARDLSKDIAKAYGVQTEEPIRVQSDLAEIMRQAMLEGKKRRQVPSSDPIDVTPP